MPYMRPVRHHPGVLTNTIEAQRLDQSQRITGKEQEYANIFLLGKYVMRTCAPCCMVLKGYHTTGKSQCKGLIRRFVGFSAESHLKIICFSG